MKQTNTHESTHTHTHTHTHTLTYTFTHTHTHPHTHTHTHVHASIHKVQLHTCTCWSKRMRQDHYWWFGWDRLTDKKERLAKSQTDGEMGWRDRQTGEIVVLPTAEVQVLADETLTASSQVGSNGMVHALIRQIVSNCTVLSCLQVLWILWCCRWIFWRLGSLCCNWRRMLLFASFYVSYFWMGLRTVLVAVPAPLFQPPWTMWSAEDVFVSLQADPP